MKETQGPKVGHARNAEKRQGAGLGGDHGEHDRSPRQLPIAQEIVAPACLSPPQPRTPRGDAEQIEYEDREVERRERAQVLRLFESLGTLGITSPHILIRDREGCGIVHGPSQRDVLCVLSRRVDPVREQHDEQVQVGVDPD